MDENPCILIVDDDRGTRLIMKRAMKESGCEVIEADDGLKALEAFQAYRIDLVLLDISMPGMDGFEACRRIRSCPGGVTVPIVIITGKNDFGDIREAYEAGATDFIAKPINRLILIERVRYMLRASATAYQLRRSQELLIRAQAVAQLGSFCYEPEKAHLTVTEEFQKIFGITSPNHTITWEDFWQRVHPGDRYLQSVLHEALAAGDHFRKDIRLYDDTQDLRFAMLQVDPESDGAGKTVRHIGIVQDITERKLLELLEADQNKILQRIARKEPLEEIYLEAARLLERQRPESRFGICRVEDGRICEMLSPNLPVRIHQAMVNSTLGPENGTCAAAAYLGRPAVARNIATSSFWNNCKDAALNHGINSSASVPIFSGTGQLLGTVAMMRPDIYEAAREDLKLMEQVANLVALAVEQQDLSQRLNHQAQHDPLTGLYNRGTLANWMAQNMPQFARADSFGAYLLIDLDRFKHINDSLGHHAGDLLLQVVSERLRYCVRGSDMLSRVGGDEFVLVLTEVRSKDDVVQAAVRILQSFNLPFSIEGHKLHIEASIGITLFPRDSTDGTVLHKNADIAMYVAKNQGGNQFQFFDKKMQEAVVQRLQIENDLRKALERGEFELYYQPQLNLASNRLVAMEALIRWNHPERGRIPANLFIHVAEESRLIIPIGQWVLREACRQNVEWQKQGIPPVRIAVNVSAIQFTMSSFIKSVRKALAETGLNPRFLEIEITETVVLNDLEKAIKNLRKLKDLGVTTTLDDFGTGYSSMTYLRNMPLDGIKVDQTFVQGIEITPTLEEKNINFVKAFADLAQNLHLHLVAEGIETEAQGNLLKTLGYSTGQGFFFSTPLPAREAAEFIQRSSSSE